MADLARPGVVAVAGSRALPASAAPLVASVCRSVLASGRSLAVGCATGADALVLSAGLPPSAVRCFAAFGPGAFGPLGACSLSAVSAVAAHVRSGGSVRWWAGGGLGVPLGVRLANRTRAVVAEASAGCVVFFATPLSQGSALAASLAAGRGMPVFAFPVGFPGRLLPAIGPGQWAPFDEGAGPWAGAFRWVPAPGLLS